MNNEVMTKHSNDGLLSALGKVPPHFLFGALLFAALWLMAEYFVPRKEYEKDQTRIELKLNDVAGDVKEILKRGPK